MTRLAIDRGNSFTKIGIFNSDELQEVVSVESSHTKEIERIVSRIPSKNIIVSDVSGGESLTGLPQLKSAHFFSSRSVIPLKNLYKTPDSLGKDRLAAAVAAFSLHPNKKNLIIQFGTCITYDFVSDKGEYSGGAISPGLFMRFKALHHYTGRLPLIENIPESIDLTGRSTEESILSGVIKGITFECNAAIEQYRALYPDLIVTVSGGDAHHFVSSLKSHIFAFPNIVLFGLIKILQHNAPQ